MKRRAFISLRVSLADQGELGDLRNLVRFPAFSGSGSGQDINNHHLSAKVQLDFVRWRRYHRLTLP